jgi:adenylate cyclase
MADSVILADAAAAAPFPEPLFGIIDAIAGSGPIVEPDLIGWTLGPGRRLTRQGALFDGLCWRLLGEGLPLWRVGLGLSTLHPQIRGFGYRWWRERQRTEVYVVGYGIETTPDFTKSPIRSVIEKGATVRYHLDGEADVSAYPLLQELKREGCTDYFACPLSLSVVAPSRDRYHWVSWQTDRPGGFSDAEIARLRQVMPALASALEADALRYMTSSLLTTYLGATASERILNGEIRRAQGETITAVILSSDMRGFTNLSDRLAGKKLIELLDDYFDAIAAPVHARGGEILKFIGDGVLAIFPTEATGREAAADAALAAAEEGLARLAALNRERAETGQVEIRIGVGLHIGEVILGNVGAADRLDFTAIGPAVNLACRLEGLTKRLDRPLILSEEFAAVARRPLVSLGFHPVKGYSYPEEVFGLP